MKKYLKAKTLFILISIYSIGAWSNYNNQYADDYEPITWDAAGEDVSDIADGNDFSGKCGYTRKRLLCSSSETYSGGINAQTNPASGGGINGTYTTTKTYWYDCERDGGNLSQCTVSSCRGDISILKCKK